MAAVKLDHAAEAVSLLARAGKQGADELGDNLRLDALVHAQLAVAGQQRIANKLQVALVDQLGSLASVQAGPNYPQDPAIGIRSYLTPDEWAGLDL